MSTQWRVASGMRTRWLGLDYAALDAVEKRVLHPADVFSPEPWQLFDQLQTLESAAMPLLNK